MLHHCASEGEFYIGGFVLRKYIEPVTFVHCMVLHCIRRNITLGGYLDTRRNIRTFVE